MSNAEAAESTITVFEGASPILRVASLVASIDYYVNALGFKVDWEHEGIVASVSRGRCAIMLVEGDQGNPGTWIWIGVSDIEPLFADYVARGARVRHPPTNYPWANEMQIEDPDGHVLRISSDPIADRPVGEWLDMKGDAWTLSPTGAWTRVERG